jgi:hypothetical protein
LKGSKPNGGKEIRVRKFIADVDVLMQKAGLEDLPEAVKAGFGKRALKCIATVFVSLPLRGVLVLCSRIGGDYREC